MNVYICNNLRPMTNFLKKVIWVEKLILDEVLPSWRTY